MKRRASIETPLDTSFWRPYVKPQQPADHSKPLSDSQRQLVFVAGAEGTGHLFITALMMRLPELMPMSLVQEQVFQSHCGTRSTTTRSSSGPPSRPSPNGSVRPAPMPLMTSDDL